VDHDYISTLEKLESITDFKEAVVEYIGGFVVRQVKTKIKCEICTCSLECKETNLPLKLINTKDRGGLIRLSPNVKKVCTIAEQCLQHVEKTKGIPCMQANIVQGICSAVLKIIGELHPYCFEELNSHDMDLTVLSSHKHVMIKRISMCYLKIRLHHLARTHSAKIKVCTIKLSLNFLPFFTMILKVVKM
jgi:hypothetical protein